MVWGQSDSVLIFFLFLSAAGVLFGKSKLAWISLAVSLLIKQTAIIAVPVLAITCLKKFGLKATLRDSGLALVIAFALLSPLVWSGYHPSIAYAPIITKFVDAVIPAGGHGIPISWDTYNIWTLFTAIQGQHNLGRFNYPDFQRIPSLGITYLIGADILFGLVFIVLVILQLINKDRLQRYSVFLFLAVVFLAFVTLGTRTQSRYYTLGIAFLIMTYFSFGWVFLLALAMVTGISFITMYGSLVSFTFDQNLLPFILNPVQNPISSSIQQIYENDLFITIFSLLALITLVYLLISAIRDGKYSESRPQLTNREAKLSL
jgi:hypothetical protein